MPGERYGMPLQRKACCAGSERSGKWSETAENATIDYAFQGNGKYDYRKVLRFE
jgi:hypothetical protein